MAVCWNFSYFDEAIKACLDKTGLDTTVFVGDDDASRATLCGTEECADYFREFKKQLKRSCVGAYSFSATRIKDGRHSPTFCDSYLTSTTTTPPVTTTAPTTTRPPVATIAPTTTSPPVETTTPATATPATAQPTNAPVASTTSTPTEPPAPVASTAAIASPVTLIPASAGTKSGNTVAYIGGATIAVVVLIGFVLFMRRQYRKRSHKSQSSPYLPTDDSSQKKTDFSEFASPRASSDHAPASTSSSSMWTHSSITTNRIPLDKVHVGPCISHGGYGEVCIGTYKNAPVAIKRLLPMRRKDPESIASFLSEIQLTSTLDHACIVTFIGVAWDAPSDLCMVSEFISGGDMRSYLGGRPSNSQGFDADKLRIAVCVAHALTYLHSLQPVVVHRDLKSRNILLTQKPELHAKLMDFGVSCDRRDTTMTAGVGTSLWMAPEVMLGERYNEKADVFSFGVVLSELDTHELPYAQAKDPNSDRRLSEMVVMQRVVSGWLKPSFSSKADPEIVALADECLQLDPNLRPSAAVVLYRLHKNRFSGTVV